MWRAAPSQTYQCYRIYFSLLYTPLVFFGRGGSRGPGMPVGQYRIMLETRTLKLVGESRVAVDGCRA